MGLSLFSLNSIYEIGVLINYIKSSFVEKISLFFCRNSSEMLSTLKNKYKKYNNIIFLIIVVTYTIIYILSKNKFIYMNF